MFSNSLVRFDRFVPVFSNTLVSFGRFAPKFSNSLVPFERFVSFSDPLERFAPCSEILVSLSSGLLLALKVSTLFRAVCSLFLNFLVPFERFVCSLSTNLFGAVRSWCSQVF